MALTREGRLFQCGATGAAVGRDEEQGGTKPAPWEGATTPTQVEGKLSGLYVEEVSTAATCNCQCLCVQQEGRGVPAGAAIAALQVAVGLHHVLAVASRLRPSGGLQEEGRRTQLLAWGRGAAAQLGQDLARDCASPQVCVVPAYQGTRHATSVCSLGQINQTRWRSDTLDLVKVHNEGLHHIVKQPLLLSIPLVSWAHVVRVSGVKIALDPGWYLVRGCCTALVLELGAWAHGAAY